MSADEFNTLIGSVPHCVVLMSALTTVLMSLLLDFEVMTSSHVAEGCCAISDAQDDGIEEELVELLG